MLSTSHQFLFVHIPKTAGNAIQGAFRQYADDKFVCEAPHQDGLERFELRSTRYQTHKHSTLTNYRREYGAAMVERLFKFTCVRNPWERAVSFWFSPHRGVTKWDRDEFEKFVVTMQPVSHYLASSPSEALARAIRNVDLVIRHEQLQEGFREACQRTGISWRPLEVRNKGPRRNYREYYDDGLRALVSERFREEIEVFGYEF